MCTVLTFVNKVWYVICNLVLQCYQMLPSYIVQSPNISPHWSIYDSWCPILCNSLFLFLFLCEIQCNGTEVLKPVLERLWSKTYSNDVMSTGQHWSTLVNIGQPSGWRRSSMDVTSLQQHLRWAHNRMFSSRGILEISGTRPGILPRIAGCSGL